METSEPRLVQPGAERWTAEAPGLETSYFARGPKQGRPRAGREERAEPKTASLPFTFRRASCPQSPPVSTTGGHPSTENGQGVSLPGRDTSLRSIPLNSSPVNQRLFRFGWTPGKLAAATGIPISQISKVVNGHRQTRRVQEAILWAVRYGSRTLGIRGRWEMTGWQLFGADWFGCRKAG